MYSESAIDREIRFIKAVEKAKILYNQNQCRGLGIENRMKVVTAEWEKIARLFEMPNKDFACKKWRYFRDKFVRDYRVVKAHDGIVPSSFNRWILYDHMKFLEPHVRGRRFRKSYKCENLGSSYFETKPDLCKDLEFIDTENTINAHITITEQDLDDNDIIEESYIYDDNSKLDYNIDTMTNSNVKNFKLIQNPTQSDEDNIEFQSSYDIKRTGIKRGITSPPPKNIKRERTSLVQTETANEDINDDPDVTFTAYLLSEIRQMSKRQKKKFKAFIFNFVLNSEDEEEDQKQVTN